MKLIKPILTKAAPLRMSGLLKEKVNEIVGQVNDLTEQVESQKPKRKSSKKKGSKMKKYLIILAALLTLTCQTAFGATYAAFLRDTGVDGVTIGIDSATKQIKVLNGNLLISGEIYYVDSVNGASDRSGKSWALAMATIDQAINKAAAAIAAGTDKGKPVIIVREGYNQAAITTDTADADVQGLTIIGLGSGSLMPTFDYDLKIGEFSVGADDVTLVNLRFRANTNTITKAVEIDDGADYTTFIGCYFVTESTTSENEFVDAIYAISTTGLTIRDCRFNAMSGSGATAVKLFGKSKSITIKDNYFMGNCWTAIINGTTTLSEDVIIEDNLLWNGSTAGGLMAEPAVELLTGTVGVFRNNDVVCNVAAWLNAVVFDGAFMARNTYNETAYASAWQIGVSVRSTTSASITAGI